MILRVYEHTAQFGIETTDYHDFTCDTYQLHNGVLHIMRFGKNDVYIPLTSIKVFEQLHLVTTEAAVITDSQPEAK